jgi:hypothetical protein
MNYVTPLILTEVQRADSSDVQNSNLQEILPVPSLDFVFEKTSRLAGGTSHFQSLVYEA